MYVPEQQKPNQASTLDPVLLNAARRIYQTFCAVHSQEDKHPLGVAINPKTRRGQVICQHKKVKPILLFGERFVGKDLLQSES